MANSLISILTMDNSASWFHCRG